MAALEIAGVEIFRSFGIDTTDLFRSVSRFRLRLNRVVSKDWSYVTKKPPCPVNRHLKL
jgi:hypothetical protein